VLDLGGGMPTSAEGPSSFPANAFPGAVTVSSGLHPAAGAANRVRAWPGHLPFADASFDIVCSFGLWASLRPDERMPCFQEMLRVTRSALLVALPPGPAANPPESAARLLHLLLEDVARAGASPGTDLEVKKLEASLAETRASLHAFRETLEACVSSAEETAQRVNSLARRVEVNSRQIHSVLRSRVWRVLCSLGGLILRIWRPLALWSEDILLVCDEPAVEDWALKSGTVVVRGWAQAPSGIARVEVLAGDGPPIPARIGLARPDIGKVRTGMRDAEHCGYQCNLDSALLADGIHAIRIRATSRRGATSEVTTQVHIDHRKGLSSEYDRWIAEFEHSSNALVRTRFEACTRRPLVSVVMPVFNPPLSDLELAIASVCRQSYENWELCVADDCSESPAIMEALRRHSDSDSRIKITRLAHHGGISAASNAALAMATGEYVAMLDHDDELAPDALLHIVEALNRRPEADVLYSDEDKVDPDGRRFGPFFKPDWSPDLLLSENYITHLVAARTSLVQEVGGFRSEYDGSQDHDLILRLTRQARDIVHLPAVLYHWRTSAGSAAGDEAAKPYAIDAAKRAIEDHLRSSGISARVEPAVAPGRWRVRYAIPQGSRVSILIPSGGKLTMLSRNLDNLADRTEYPDYEIVIIDNSRGHEVQRFTETWRRNGHAARYVDMRRKPFNFSALNNAAAQQCDSPLLVFLNDDTEVVSPDWLTAMVELGARPEVGAVGAKLLYPDGVIQHAGVVMGLGGPCSHAFKGLDGNARHYHDFPDLIRNVSVVTGACMLVRSNVFREVGGFDEERFPVDFGDIDLCLRIGRKGYRVLYTPYALLFHFESFSRIGPSQAHHSPEVLAMQEKWRDVIAADPFYSPNLTRVTEDYSCRRRI
jgi:GT2 family glycosyltransferase